MKKLRRSLLFLMVLAPCLVFGQKKYNKSYIIKKNGDKVMGLALYKNWKVNPDSILFVDEMTHKEQYIKPVEVLELGIEREDQMEIYRSRLVNVNLNSIKSKEQEEIIDFDTQVSAFLMLMVDGQTELYKHTLKDDRTVLYLDKDDKIIELVSIKNYPNVSNQDAQPRSSYVYQLAKLLNDCTDITGSDLEALRYDEREISKVIVKYNSCGGKAAEGHIYKGDKVIVKIGVIAGLSLTHLTTGGVFKHEQNFSKSTDPAAGLSATFILPRTNQKTAIYTELLYRSYSVHTENIIPITSFDQATRHFNYVIAPKYLKLFTAYQYQFTQSKLKPFFNLGMTNSLMLSKKMDKSYTYRTDNQSAGPRESTELIAAEPRTYEQGLALGLGIGVRSFVLELRGEISNGFSAIKTKRTSPNTGYLLLHYNF
jgi:hypothetical protein